MHPVELAHVIAEGGADIGMSGDGIHTHLFAVQNPLTTSEFREEWVVGAG